MRYLYNYISLLTPLPFFFLFNTQLAFCLLFTYYRPMPNFCNPMAGPVTPTVPYPVQQIPLNPQPQAFPPWANTGGAAPIVVQQSHPPLQAPLQPTQFPLQQTQPPWESSQSHQQSGSGVQKQIPPALPASQNFGQPQSSNVSKLEVLYNDQCLLINSMMFLVICENFQVNDLVG